MKAIVPALLFVLTFNYCFGQQDFRKGYILQHGDTLSGYVDYRGDNRSAQLTTFKPTLESPEQRFTPTDIAGYGFDAEGKVYESKLLPDSSLVLFLNTLIKGKASLYFYREDSQKEHYYIQKDGGSLVELKQLEYYKTDESTGRTYKVNSKVYIGTLAEAFSDCPEIKTSQVKQVNLTDKSLTNIAQRYNLCIDPTSITHQQKEKNTKITFAPIFTYHHSWLKFSGDTYLSRASFEDESVKVGGGISANIPLPRINEKLSLQLDLLYLPLKFTTTLNEEGKYGSSNTYKTYFDLAYVKLPVQLRYLYPRGKLRPFVNAGAMLGYAIKDENMLSQTTNFAGSANTVTSPAIPANGADGFRNLMQGLTAGAGLMYPVASHTLFLEARYEANTGVSAVKGIGSTANTLYILLSYGF